MNYYEYLLETPIEFTYDTNKKVFLLEQDEPIPARNSSVSQSTIQKLTDFPMEMSNSISNVFISKLNREFELYSGEKNPKLSVYTKTLLFLYTLWKLPIHVIEEWSQKSGIPGLSTLLSTIGYMIMKFGPAQLLLGLTPKGFLGFIQGLFSFVFVCLPERIWFLIKTILNIVIWPIKGIGKILGLVKTQNIYRQESYDFLTEAEKQTNIFKRGLLFMVDKLLKTVSVLTGIISKSLGPMVSCLNNNFGKYGRGGIIGIFLLMKNATIGTGTMGIFLFYYIKMIAMLIIYGGLIVLAGTLAGGASQIFSMYNSI